MNLFYFVSLEGIVVEGGFLLYTKNIRKSLSFLYDVRYNIVYDSEAKVDFRKEMRK